MILLCQESYIAIPNVLKLSKLWNESSTPRCMVHVFMRYLDFIDLLPKLICLLLLRFTKNTTTCLMYWQIIQPSEETEFYMSVWYICTTIQTQVCSQVCLLILLVQHLTVTEEYTIVLLLQTLHEIHSTGLRWFVSGFLYVCDGFCRLI